MINPDETECLGLMMTTKLLIKKVVILSLLVFSPSLCGACDPACEAPTPYCDDTHNCRECTNHSHCQSPTPLCNHICSGCEAAVTEAECNTYCSGLGYCWQENQCSTPCTIPEIMPVQRSLLMILIAIIFLVVLLARNRQKTV